ncbi:initiation factor 2 [Suhomyces tanzawaensis NRRL Y-17324]|uniref:Translation initiation factor IF-2, mitochondrial n=1 Tax=Suhomyces tanzawaensis NRRL Y-17324 TaxID=984487 RepID=A0A1E4SIZ8_9ASCO|nr:initiation factor 2 [Suhomyces tanzawaensis NRRL Y-17324]ODV79474.1 initiation factor 2 [Suhomyces tanzawaensis NRRL Y-17324]
MITRTYTTRTFLSRIGQERQRRHYSDFLKNLPRVGGGISKFGKAPSIQKNIPPKDNLTSPNSVPKKQPPPQGNNRSNQQNSQQKTNRFAQKYANPKPAVKAPKPVNPSTKYEEIRKSLREKQAKQNPAQKKVLVPSKKKKAATPPIKINLPPFITVSNLATIMNVPFTDVLKKLENFGFEDLRHNYILDKENATMIADEYNFEVNISESYDEDVFPEPPKPELLKERPPIVTIMGHVDHGKTTILDFLRKSSIVDKEFGGITQHIGAFSVFTPISKKKITFLDTPGHAAFLKMRERGAMITDIVVLVVAGDDSIMPQTTEAIKHTKKSGVPMIVAINKCDKQGIDIDKVLRDLYAQEIDIEDYGGEVQTVKVSGKTGLNMDKLEEAIITLSEMNEFKAEQSNIQSEGWIIESSIEKGLGNKTNLLVSRGTIKVGDYLVAGTTYCKVKGIRDENGMAIKSAGPSTPIQIWGWKELPGSGDQVLQVKSELVAKKVTANRIARNKELSMGKDIEEINRKRQEEINEIKMKEKMNEVKLLGLDEGVVANELEQKAREVRYIVRSDVYGSAEAIKESINELGNEEVRSVVLNTEAGVPTDSDITLAKTLDAKILCFNIKVPKPMMMKADKEGVVIKDYNIIYRLIEDVTTELTSHLKPRIEIKTVGEVDIKDVFVVTIKKSKVKIAGCKVTNGLIKKSSKIRVLRGEEVVYDGTLGSLKYIKDDVSEVRKGKDCGIAFENWDKFEAGDSIQVYEEVEHQRFL